MLKKIYDNLPMGKGVVRSAYTRFLLVCLVGVLYFLYKIFFGG
jgi:cbb3-type cytochrome oxidase subunit 3